MATINISKHLLIGVDELLAAAEVECPKCHTVLPVKMTDKALVCPRCREVGDRAVVIPYFTEIIGKLQGLKDNADQLKFRIPVEEGPPNPESNKQRQTKSRQTES